MDYEPYLSAWRARSERQRQAEAAEGQRALEQARRLAQILEQYYGATEVILVGSLARGEFGHGSDIDLAVTGVPPEVFFRAGAELERAAGGFKVDLIPLESASEFFVAEARRDGVVLS